VAQKVHALAEFQDGMALLPLQDIADYEGTIKIVKHALAMWKFAG